MLDICKITLSNNNNNNDGKPSSILMDKIKSNYVDKSSHLNVIDEDNICLTNLIQLIITLIACLLMLFTGLYQFFKIKRFFLRYIHHNENYDHNDDNIIDHNVDNSEGNDSIEKNSSNNINDNNKDNVNLKKNSINNNSTYNNNNHNINNNDNYSTSSSNSTSKQNSDPIQILFKFHNIRCTIELVLLAINSLELCRSLLPLPFYSVTFWSDKIITSIPIATTSTTTTTVPTSILFDKNIHNQEYVSTQSTVSSTLINNDNNFDKFQLILYSPPFLIYNSILTIFTTLILIGYHRILESRNITELLFLSLSMETILGFVRIYQIHSNVPSHFDLEPFLNWSTALCLFILAIIDGYVVYKQRFKLKRINKKLNDERLIGYKHSISTFFSKILFWWLTPFLWHGYREPLEQEDLGHLREEDSARAYYDQFLLIYKTTAKKNQNPSLWLCYLKSSWKWFTLGGILKLFGDLSALIGPLSIHQIVDYIEYEYNRSYLNNTSILYNIQNHFDGKQSVNFNSNNNNINNIKNNNNNNNNNFGNNARMNLFNRNNLNTIWSLLRAHTISNRHHNINGIIESHVDNIATTTQATIFDTENKTKMSILNSTRIIIDDSNDNINTVETNKLDGIFNQIIGTSNSSSNSNNNNNGISNNESLFSFILPSSTSMFINRNLEYGENIIRPIFSMVNSISDFFQIPSMTGVNLWANISWISDKQQQQQQQQQKILNLNDMNSIPGLYTNYYNQSDFINGNNVSNFDNQYYTTQYLYYYYPNWSEFLSNGWIIAWIVLISAILQGGLSQASTHLLNMTGIRIKTSLQGLIYRKTLLLSSSCIEINSNLNKNNGNDSDIEVVNNSSIISQKYQKNKNKKYDNNYYDNNIKCKLSNDSDNDSVNISENNINNIGKHDLNSNTKRDAGSITNLMTEDSLNVMSFFWIAHYVWAIPLKIGLVMYLLYLKLGISAIIGSFVCILTMTPLQFLIGKAMSENSEISAQCTDDRLRKINDIFLGIKLIKLNAWEKVYKDKIAAVRKKELKYLNKDSFYWTVMTFLTHLSSVLITFVTLAVYVKLETNTNSNTNQTTFEQKSMFDSIGFEFTASRLFSALALFNQLTVPLLIFPITVPIIISAIVSTKRLERFLKEPEVQREFEGIKNMARILSKSDAALDMYEIKIPMQEIKDEKSTISNHSFSPITEIESSFEFPSIEDSLDSEVIIKNPNTLEQNINNNNDDICKNDLQKQSSLKFDNDSQQKYYAEIIDDIERRNSGKWDDTKLYCQFSVEPRKSFCDEIDEFDKEYNEIDDFYMENKPLTQSKLLNKSQVPSLPATNVPTIQQYFNVNNNNNKSNKKINYNNDSLSNDGSNNNNDKIKNNKYNCYDEKNNDTTLKDIFRIQNEEKQQKGKKEIEKKEKENIQTKENEIIQNTDLPRISINTKLKREYKSDTLPKKRRNKDLMRGGGCGVGNGGTKCSHQQHYNGAQNNTIENLNSDKAILGCKYVITKPLKSISDQENCEKIESEKIDKTGIDTLKKKTVRNSRKLVSGRESFQFQLADNISVSISNGVFSWDNCNISLKIDELNIPRGKLTIVVGKNGSGKTSLIAALLKEMHQISGDVSWNKYSTIAYVPQIPWLLNASIRDNILFGESFRPKRYEKVLEACALKPDIDLMPEGDMTLIGERGINLSGGQKQRINIARSLYSSANVIMMDDPLSSLDNEVAKHVFENSIKKMLLKANRTVILVTQKLQLLSSANYIIVMKDCCVQSAGNYEQIQKEHPDIIKEWNSIIAKGYEMDQISPNKTARERWRLFKNISRIGLLRPQDSEQEHLLSIYLIGIKVKLKIIEIIQRNSDENQNNDSQSLYMQSTTKRRSSIFGSRHLIYDLPLPIDECQNDDIIIKRRGSKRSILLMGLGNTISGTNCELRQHNDGINCNNSSRIGRKNSVIRVKSLQPEVKNYANRTPVVRNISSPGRFLDTKARTSDSEFKQKNGFRQFLNRMSSRKSNLGTKLHRPISASTSIQSISEESHQNIQRVESSCSSEILDDESIQDLNDNTTSPTTDEERKYGEIPLQIYMLYLKSCGLPIVLTFFITALIWQCLRVYTDVWLRYWTEMDSGIIQESITETLATAFNLNRDINTSYSNSFNQNNYNNDDKIEYNKGGGTRIFTENDKNNDENNHQQQYDTTYCFNMYSIISSICILMSVISIPAGQKAGCNAREKLHNELLESLLAKPLHFFQVTPLGKIINRFSNDMAIIDKKIAPTSQRLLQFTLLCLCAVLINLAITPWFIVLTIPICFAYYIIQKFYRCSSRELQRLENITNSPVISHFNETIQGVTTIRAYSQESRFTETLFKRLEANTIAFVMLNTSNRWLGIALDYLGGVIVFIAIVTALLAASIAKGQQKLYNEVNSNFNSHDGIRYYKNGININFKNEESLSLLSSQLLSPSPSLVGLAINYTLLVPIYLNWVVKLLSDMEMYVGSVERVAYYKQKLYENFNLWKNDYRKKNENHHHHHHNHDHHQYNDDNQYHQNINDVNDENGENQQNVYHHNNCNCKEKHNEKLLYCEKRNSNSENFLSSYCTECSKITEEKNKKNKKKISVICKTITCCCTVKCCYCCSCCCNESKIVGNHHELKEVIYNTVPISWPQKGDIEFDNVTLRHQGQQQNVITDLSLKIPAGQKIGICGRTGSGKSTLALSLFSVMEIMNGKILIDGININSIHPDEVRSRLSIIPQDVHLFNATIRENLDPRGHYSDLELWNCLELAQLKDIVTRMIHGLDTEIIEGGFNLSAGQRQLFCLARAVLRGSVCLVLDEATSSLDAITETALMDAAHNAFKGRTILTIAHRLSTLHNYDRIIVLENGKIIEDGSPNELKSIPNGKFLTMLQSDH